MTKKIVLGILLTMILSLCLFLFGCHTSHTYDAGTVVKEPTCTEDGIRLYTCTKCGEVMSEYIGATGHTPSEEYSHDRLTHCKLCTVCGDKTDEADHEWADGFCSVCGAEYIPEVLEFTLNGSYYTVSGIGTVLANDIVIPSVYQDLPVREIAAEAFRYCESLTSVTIPDSIQTIGDYAFFGCASLKRIEIPDSVTSLGVSAFDGCSGAQSITIGSGLSKIADYAFCGCSSVSVVTIPQTISEIGVSAFEKCNALTDIVIPDSVTQMGGWAFYQCVNLSSVTLSENLTQIENSTFSGCVRLQPIEIPQSVKVIKERAFSNCTRMQNFVVPETVQEIQFGAFESCTGLESITLPFTGRQIDGEVNTHVGYIFAASTPASSTTVMPQSLKTITVKGGTITADSLRSTRFENVILGADVQTIMPTAFCGMQAITSLTIDQLNPTYAASQNCVIDKEAKVLVAGCVSSLIPADGSVTAIGDSAFSGCTYLKSIQIPLAITQIGNGTFLGCTALETVYLPSALTSIGSRAFSGCTSLNTINIPQSVTSIGEYAFASCNALTSIVIPDSVTTMGDFVFDSTANYLTINCRAAKRPTGWSFLWNANSSAQVVWGYSD